MTSENNSGWNPDPNQPGGSSGYQPPGYQPPAGDPNRAPGSQPPAQGGYQPPAQGGYQPPAQDAYDAASYQPPAQPGGQTPPPAYGTPYGQQAPQPYPGTPYPPVQAAGQLADWGTRALGGLIDYVVPGIIFALLASPFAATTNLQTGVTTGGNAPLYWLFNSLLPLAWWVFNSGWKQGTTGQTFGKQVAKTRLVSEATGQPIGFGLAVLRHIVHVLDTLACFVGWLFPLWDAKRQTFADKIMKTVVIKNAA